jgi:hypothetical protein
VYDDEPSQFLDETGTDRIGEEGLIEQVVVSIGT